MEMKLADMHCHLDFATDPSGIASKAAAEGVGLFSTTVLPRAFGAATAMLGACPNVRVGVGAHPWWAQEAQGQMDDFDQAFGKTRFVGEVGLDFSTRHGDSHDAQVRVFRHIATMCADRSETVLSLHSVRAADAVLDILQDCGCLEAGNRCIFHWFSGSCEQLHRAIDAGCWFSLGERMLDTKRGREYARLIPKDKLLLETDLPPQSAKHFGWTEQVASLYRALHLLARARSGDNVELQQAIAVNSGQLLGDWGRIRSCE